MDQSSLGYQGKETTIILQAPTRKALNTLVHSTRKFTKEHNMDEFKVLERGKDTDGGYRAVVTAHNLNPITWIKSKVGSSESKESARGQLEADRAEKEAKKRRQEEERVAERAHRESVRQSSIKARREREIVESTYTPKQQVEEKIAKAEQQKKYREIKPTLTTRLVRGAGSIASTMREVSKTRGATSIKRKYGEGGRVTEEEIERAPKNFYAPTRSTMMGGGSSSMGGSLAHLRSLTAPGGMAGGMGGDMGLGHLRELMYPGQARKVARPTVHDLSEGQEEVYNAIMGGANTIPAIAVAADMKEASVKKAVKVLAKKGLID